MHLSSISVEDIQSIYAGLHRIGALGASIGDGFSRPAYSDVESKAMRYFERLAREHGLHARYDAAANLIIETAGEFAQWVETGSHLDTVPGGGNFDGAAGVVAGFLVLQHAHRSKARLQKGLRLRIWRGEESAAFGLASIGSRAAFGLLAVDALKASDGRSTLAEAMRSQRANPERVRKGLPAIEAAERDAISAHIELHIEQGNVLEKAGDDIGVVTGIRGSRRGWVMLSGQFDHSGATPMGLDYRRDVNLAMAYMQVRLDQLAASTLAAGEDLVQTIGVVNASGAMNRRLSQVVDNAISRVSGSGYFSLEVRSTSPATAQRYWQQAGEIISRTAAEFGIEAEIETFSQLAGIEAMDAELQASLIAAADASRLRWQKMPSGAWHDAAVLCGVERGEGVGDGCGYGDRIPVGMLFVPSRGGISHSSEEFTSDEELARGATVLATAMLGLACEDCCKESVTTTTDLHQTLGAIDA